MKPAVGHIRSETRLEVQGRRSADLRSVIEAFVQNARQPVLLEAGDAPYALAADCFSLTETGTRLTLECWTSDADSDGAAQRNLIRRVTGIRKETKVKLELETEHFGGRKGILSLVDLAHPAAAVATRQGNRLQYREQFRISLKRQFPDWRIAELSSEQDLEHSLSPVYPRALLRKGNQSMAAIGASEDCLEPDGVLSFGLIWLDYVRRREPKLAVGSLALFLPIGFEANTCHRVRYLNPNAAQFQVFAYGSGITEERVDPAAYTNFETRLDPFQSPATSRSAPYGDEALAWAEELAALDEVSSVPLPNGAVSLRVAGLEFARMVPEHGRGNTLLYGVDRKRTAVARHLPQIKALARGLGHLRQPDTLDRTNRTYLRQPEAWLEAQVRAQLDRVDATLVASSLYEQAPQYMAGDRSIMDLLAADGDGRLCVIEIKASQDIHLPLQALDYWMRVKWHLERGEFARKRYFPGLALASGARKQDAPSLLLVAPAIDFHPTNETILRYFSSDVAVTRIGVGIEWRRDLRVMFRM
ncbi:MAG: hypothetical protein ABI824_09540 [Acidobacteriota bacterium]